MTDIEDYLIDQNGKDWRILLQPLIPPLPPKFTLWMVNRLGDLVVSLEDGSIHFLALDDCSLTRIADNREDFFVRINHDGNANDWLALPLVDACVVAGMRLAHNQCYGFKIAPVLGGEYTADNLAPTDLAEYYRFVADVSQQTRDMPDGTQIVLSIKE